MSESIKFEHGGARPGAGRPWKKQPWATPRVREHLWYCVRTQHDMERAAAISVGVAGFEVFSPMVAPHSISAILAGTRTTLAPLFPRYIFARFSRDDPEWAEISRMRGVEGVLGTSATQPVALPDGVMTALREECTANGCMYSSEPSCRSRLFEGSALQLTAGRFTGFKGVVEWSNARRVRVLLQLLGGSVSVNVLRRDTTAA